MYLQSLIFFYFFFLLVGELMTFATWMRHFITQHKDYKHDSRVSDKIQYDLFNVVDRVQNGEITIPEMFGDINTR